MGLKGCLHLVPHLFIFQAFLVCSAVFDFLDSSPGVGGRGGSEGMGGEDVGEEEATWLRRPQTGPLALPRLPYLLAGLLVLCFVFNDSFIFVLCELEFFLPGCLCEGVGCPGGSQSLTIYSP